MTRHALADHGAIEHVERGEQGGRAVAFIIVRHRSTAALLHRQAGLGAVKRLDLALLINREDQRLIRQIEIETDNVLDLGHEVGITGQLEGPRQMRLEPVRLPDFLHRGGRNPGPRAHRAHAPLRGVGRLFVQRQIDHPFDFPRRKRLAARRTRGVLQKSVHTLGGVASAPAPYREHTFTHGARDLAGPRARTSQHHNPRPPHHFLRGVAVSHQFVQPLSIFSRNRNAFDLAHPARLASLTDFGNHPMRMEH